MTNPSDILRAKLNLETAQLAWPELERHFARGDVIKVAPGMDLVDAALQIAENNAATVQQWLADARLAKAERSDADVLGGELAVPCNPRSASAGLNPRLRPVGSESAPGTER